MNQPAVENSGCLGVLFKLLGITPSAKNAGAAGPLPCRLRDDFLSPAEISFYHVLRTAVGDEWTVCPKVALGDLFFVTQPQNNQAARNRIAQKHVDFLLCEPGTMKPRVGIELDDASHDSAKRIERDMLVDDVFAAASLPLLRIRVQPVYQPTELAERLADVMAGRKLPSEPHAAISAVVETPIIQTPAAHCPKCGIPLVSRTGPRGTFFGCSNFPRCRHTQEIA